MRGRKSCAYLHASTSCIIYEISIVLEFYFSVCNVKRNRKREAKKEQYLRKLATKPNQTNPSVWLNGEESD